VFAEKGEREVLNKVGGEKPYLRTTLTDGLNEALAKNKPNKDLLGLKDIKIFEIGTVWKGGEEKMMTGIVTEKEPAKEDPLSMYVKETAAYEELPISATERYFAFSRYPSITRDIAMWVPIEVDKGEVRHELVNAAGLLLARIDFFDEFKKGDKTSVAFRLVFQSPEKTLTDAEVNIAMNDVYEAVKKRGWEVR
jgi:phenylalanyl-tRNA synthetase beta subunit